MILILIVLSVLFFLILLAVIAGFVFVLYFVTGGFNKPGDFTGDQFTPLSEVPMESVAQALQKRTGDKRFEEPITLPMNRSKEVSEEAENPLETDAGEWV